MAMVMWRGILFIASCEKISRMKKALEVNNRAKFNNIEKCFLKKKKVTEVPAEFFFSVVSKKRV